MTQIRKLTDGVHWVGVVDWNCRDFHGYETRRGVTYNAYLVQDEKTALIDLVKAPFADELIAKVESLCPLERIDYLVVNHGEPDHSSALNRLREAAPNARLIASKNGADSLGAYYGVAPEDLDTMKTGDTVSLGRRTLRFLATPMLHWPDSMATYCPEEKILFSMDGWGQHLATSERFDDELDDALVFEELKRYYANILMPFAKPTRQAVEQVLALDLGLIAPAHGVIWRRDIRRALDAYADWAAGKRVERVDVVYDTMWNSTERMAEAIVGGATEAGVSAVLRHLRKNTLTDLAMEALDAGGLALGTPTLNLGMMPSVAAYLCYVGNLRPPPKPGLVFGSFGWRATGAEQVGDQLRKMRVETIDEPLTDKWRPDDDALELCRQAGRRLAEKTRESLAPRDA